MTHYYPPMRTEVPPGKTWPDRVHGFGVVYVVDGNIVTILMDNRTAEGKILDVDFAVEPERVAFWQGVVGVRCQVEYDPSIGQCDIRFVSDGRVQAAEKHLR